MSARQEPRHVCFAFEASMCGYTYADAFYPGALAVSVALVGCSARCSFCINAPGSYAPERLEVAPAVVLRTGQVRAFRNVRASLSPSEIVRGAALARAQVLVVTGGEPTHSSDFTLSLCRLARSNGLRTLVLTNGLSDPATIRKLAPYVNGILLGVKGSLSERFYAEHVKAPGGPERVRLAARTWRDAGVWVGITHLIAPPSLQAEEEHERAEGELYAWLAAELPLVPVSFGGTLNPHTLAMWGTAEEDEAHSRRLHAAARRARASLPYAADISGIGSGATVYHCHACDREVLRLQWPMVDCGEACTMATGYCAKWRHEQHATAGKCGHCGASVPLLTLPGHQLLANRRLVEDLARR